MLGTFRKIRANLVCRWQEFWTFKVDILITILNTCLEVLMWFFLAKIIDPATLGYEGIGYMPFILIGSVAIYFVDGVGASFTDKFNNDADNGIYKLAYLSNMHIVEYFSINFVTMIVFDIFTVFIPMITVYMLLVGFSDTSTVLFMAKDNLITIIIALLIFIVGNLGFQLMTVGTTLFLKQGDPVSFFMEQFNRFFSGQYFPTTFLPKFLGVLPKILPSAYIILIWRETLFLNHVYYEKEILVLIISGLIVNLLIFLGGFYIFYYGIKRAKREGRWF
ncbi:hypothetical protein COU56_04965 [Candidatus Pacearchaeota archaeon CG10_big_fil_rev_8_21_14_0_10_31_9]|nr:MAG: hypothetical protein COU56_04965 [Candidatus Pacearchaeota archaeon CG10_big_fil_rev_8_21_14_0_10_31_9]